MVNKIHYRWDFVGLSTDTKPTPDESPKVVNGSTYYESDTSKLFVFYEDTWYERKPLGGGGGSSYTAGDGIEITNNTISVDTEVVQPKLTAGTNITIDEDNVISAGAGGSDGARTLKQSDYNWPADNPDGVALWLMPVGYYRASDEEPVKVYITSTFSYTANATNFNVLVGSTSNSGTTIFRLYASSDSTHGYSPAEFYILSARGLTLSRFILYNTYNSLTSTSTVNPLSAYQGKVLKDMIDNLPTGGEPDYSTSEVDTGTKWVDGNTIYKKTVEIPSLPSGSPYVANLGITNLYRVIEVKGFLYNPLDLTGGVPLIQASPDSASSQIGVSVYSGQLSIDYSGRSGWSGYATVYYTKSV